MTCRSCQREIPSSAKFCPHCGRITDEPRPTVTTVQPKTEPQPVQAPQQVPEQPPQQIPTPVPQQTPAPQTFQPTELSGDEEPKPKTSKGLLIFLIFILIVLILVLAGGISYFLASSWMKTASQPAAAPTSTPTVTAAPTASPSPAFLRQTTYDGSYTYKDMDSIHASTPASDEECLEMEKLIHTFNSLWLEYINNSNESIFSYLRQGTNAYQYATAYSEKIVTQEYELMDVKDARVYGNTYYVWVHEIIKEYHSNEIKRLEYHWVYKIGRDASGYYVENYTADPFYK